MSKLLQGYFRCQDNGNSAVTTWGEIHVKTVYQNCKNMFTPTWPSPKQISVITFSTKCQGPGTSRASDYFAELDVKTIEKDPCDHFLYQITGSLYPSSRCRDTTSNPFFSTNYKFEDIKENKNPCEKTHFAALDVKTIEKKLWSFSLQNKQVLVPLEPVQGHHLKPNIWRHKGKQTHFEKN